MRLVISISLLMAGVCTAQTQNAKPRQGGFCQSLGSEVTRVQNESSAKPKAASPVPGLPGAIKATIEGWGYENVFIVARTDSEEKQMDAIYARMQKTVKGCYPAAKAEALEEMRSVGVIYAIGSGVTVELKMGPHYADRGRDGNQLTLTVSKRPH